MSGTYQVGFRILHVFTQNHFFFLKHDPSLYELPDELIWYHLSLIAIHWHLLFLRFFVSSRRNTLLERINYRILHFSKKKWDLSRGIVGREEREKQKC